MTIYKAAVVGCGRIGVAFEGDPKQFKPASHAGAFKSHPSVELSALVDADPAQIEKAKALFPDVPTFSSCEAMLQSIKPDIVTASTPPAHHRSVVELCARAAVSAILCEKPIADSLRDGQAMIEACRQSGSLLFVNHTRRFDTLFYDLRAKLRAGDLGEILQGTVYYTAGVFNTGTHIVDLLRFLLGDVAWVSARTENRVSCPADDISVNGWLQFVSGVPVALQALDVRDYYNFEIRLYGRKGCVVIDRFGFCVEHTPLRDVKEFAGYRELDVDHRVRTGLPRGFMGGPVQNVVACLDGTAEILSRGEDGLAALEILLALKESSREDGRRVPLAKVKVEA